MCVLQALLETKEECHYTHIILDEVHERSIEIDFAMFLARRLADQFTELKIILMSATLQGKLFVEYFRQTLGPSRVSDPYFVGIRRFPVRDFFIDELSAMVSKKKDKVQLAAMKELRQLQGRLESDSTILSTMAEVSPHAQEVCINLILSVPEPGQSVLIFLPGLSDIIDLQSAIMRRLKQLDVRQRYRVFVLHPQVPSEEQEEVFTQPQRGEANVIISTSISESSLTIPHLKLVIDFAIRRYMIYDPSTHTSKLTRRWCSKASCTQRAGRVGRTSPGAVIHLITREDYKKLPDFNLPDIISSPLSKTVLRAKQLVKRECGVSLPSHLLSRLIEPPSLLQFEAALHDLVDIGALRAPRQLSTSEEEDTTFLGEFSVDVPLDLHLCRLILLGVFFGCPNDAVVLAAGLSMYQDIFTIPTRMIMEDMNQFCHSLARSTFSRLSLDKGCCSNPIMVRNMFLDWLRFADCHWTDNRRYIANKFSSSYAVRVKRLLHFESQVADIARSVSKWLPFGTRARAELETLSRIDRERPCALTMCDNTYFTQEGPDSTKPPLSLRPNSSRYVPPHLRNLTHHRAHKTSSSLHFCRDNLLLKVLITAASPSEIMLGERRCDSSRPNMRTLARRCVAIAKEADFPPAYTLAMNFSFVNLLPEQSEQGKESMVRDLYKSFPSGFRCPVKVKLERKEEETVVVNFSPARGSGDAVTRIARDMGYRPNGVDSSTVELSELPPELHLLCRISEGRGSWEVEDVKGVFPTPFHPSSIIWHMLDRERRLVNTTHLNYRNPTGLLCLFKKPDYPYLAIASRSFVNDHQVTFSPNITLLPPSPHSLVMIVALQLSTSVTELLVDREKREVRGLRLNHNQIHCREIERYLSVEKLVAINHFRETLSRTLQLSTQNRKIPREQLESGDLQKALAALFSPSPAPETTDNTSQQEEKAEDPSDSSKMVWELITPGRLMAVTYPQLRCSLLGSTPFKESPACSEEPAAASATPSPPVQYQESTSTKLLMEMFDRIEMPDESDEEPTEVALSSTGWLLSSSKKKEESSEETSEEEEEEEEEGRGERMERRESLTKRATVVMMWRQKKQRKLEKRSQKETQPNLKRQW